MTRGALERRLIRLLVPVAAATAVVGAVVLHGPRPFPAVALGSVLVLEALRTLAIFYAFLLLLVPLVRAARGELPIELSFRGARWEADAPSVPLEALEERLSSLSQRVDMLSESVAQMRAGGNPSPPRAP
jgi:hypothetical protein